MPTSDDGLSAAPQPSQIRPAARSTAPLDNTTVSATTISSHGRPAWSAAYTRSACPSEDTNGGRSASTSAPSTTVTPVTASPRPRPRSLGSLTQDR